LAEVSALLKTFESAGLRLTGTILNGFDPRKARSGGYSYNYNYRYEYKRRAD
jgi:tyrosine-protein kinase Etk/Wzc